MSNVLLTTNSAELEVRVLEASGGTCIVVPSGALPAEPAQLLAQVQHQSLPDILVLDASEDADAALALASRFDRELPGTGVVLIGDPAILSMRAMRVGVRDVLPASASAADLASALDRVWQAVQLRRMPGSTVIVPPVAAAPGRLLTVLSPKGGAGKTTIATNLAVGLAQAAPGSVVLVDLDVQFGDVATALSLEPEYTLDGVVHGGAIRDAIALKTHLTQHSSGLSVVCAPDSPAVGDSVTPEQVSALLSMLKSQFPFVVVDTAAGLEARTLAALDHTTDPVLVSTFDVPGSRGLRKEIATLRELGMLANTRQVILNFADSKSGLTVGDVEATIRSRVDLTFPFSRSVTAALNTGVPLIHHKPNDAVSKQLRKLLSSYVTIGGRRSNGRHRVSQ